MREANIHDYDDIIHLSHPTSATHPRMSLYDRAAQFSPFAALTGHEEAIKETARLTGEKRELDEAEKERLDRQLQKILANPQESPDVTITWFKPDAAKAGGTYATHTGKMKRVDEYAHTLIMQDGTGIPIADIYSIE